MAAADDEQEIKILVVLDTEAIERFNFKFEDNELAELLIEAETGSIRLAVTDVQKSELEAHLDEQLGHVKSVAKNLIGGAGRKRIAAPNAKAETDGVQLPRILSNALVADSIQEMVTSANALRTDLADFFKTKNLEIISTNEIQAGRILSAYFAAKPPFSAGRKKHEFPDAFAIAAIGDLAAGLTDGTEVHVVSADSDWARAFDGSSNVRIHGTVGEALQYIRKLEDVANDFEELVVGKETKLNEAITAAFEDLGFANYDYWESDVADVELDSVEVDSVTVTNQVNRVLTVDVVCTITFSCVVTYNEDEYAPARSAKLTLTDELSGIASATMTPTFDGIEKVTFSFTEKVVSVSFEDADDVEEIFDDEDEDEDE